MRELTTESLLPIRNVIPGQNYGNIKARLDQLLPEDLAQSFSRIEVRYKDATWYSDSDRIYRPYSEAGELEKEEIAIRLEEIKKMASGALLEQMPYVEDLFVVPDADAIFWYKADDGEMNVVISQWGFEKRTIEQQTNVICDLISAPRPLTQIQVVLKCKFSNGEPAADFEFYLNIFNNKKLCRTSDKGEYSIGSLFPDKQFSVETPDGSQKIEFTVKKDAEYYVVFELPEEEELSEEVEVDDDNSNGEEDQKIEVPRPEPDRMVTIRLLGYKGEFLPDMPFKLRMADGKILEGITDKEGNTSIPLKDLPVGKKCNISFTMTAEYQKSLSLKKNVVEK
ncbi:MAG: hypothetical protein K2M31_06225 [Muribaculaceae bacterium]|nr:hypothetical protein [Muribaculaceae bacterium]